MIAPPLHWNRGDLVRRLCHALSIAKQVVERLAPSGYIDPVEPANNVRPEKVVSETSLLLLAASWADTHPEIKANVERVAQLLVPHARSDRTLLGVCMEPALALDYAHAHICLAHIGYPDEGFNRLLRQSVRAQASASRERLPHRMLEQQWLNDLWNDPEVGSRRPAGSMATRSVLNLPMDLLNGTREDIYAFTHALMYSSLFNTGAKRWPRAKSIILEEAEGALARCLDEEDYDLAGELLLAWPLTGTSWSARATFGFRVLARVEDTAGFLPTPSTRIERANALCGDERVNYLLATAYHTAYVMGLLCATALQSGRSPLVQVPTRGAVCGAAAGILDHLGADSRSVHWREEFGALVDRERDAIAGFLLDVTLRRKVSQRDFVGVRELLEVASAWNLTNSPVPSQAAEMLERLTTFASIRSRKELGAERKAEAYENVRVQRVGRGRNAGHPAPPAQIQRAALPHPAPASGSDELP